MARLVPALLFLLCRGLVVHAAPISPVRTVRGMDGQPDLRLDYGRELALAGKSWLSPVEKAPLEARRIAGAPRLSLDAKLRRLVAIVEGKLPADPELGRYRASTNRQLSRRGSAARLSSYVRDRAGTCRERAFLLHGMLREARVPSRVVYCEVYDPTNRYRSDHAYVEARLMGQRVLLDPFNPTPVQPLRRVRVRSDPGFVRGVETEAGWLYLPTRDLRLSTK